MINLDSKFHTKPLKFFLTVNKKEVPLIIWNIVLYSSGQIVIVGATYLLGRIIDDLTTPGGHIRFLLAALMICVTFYEIFYRTGHIFEINIRARIRKNIKTSLFDHTRSLSFGYFSDRFAGEIAHKVVSTTYALERMMIITTNNFIENGLLIPFSIIIFSFVNIYYGIFVAVWAIVLVAGSWLLSKEMNRRAGLYAAEEAKTTGSIVDVYGNIATVKVYGKINEIGKSHDQIEKERRAFLKLGWWDVLVFNYQGLSIVILCAGILTISVMLHTRNLVSIGSLVFISAATLRLFSVAWEMAVSVAEFVRFRGESIQNLQDLVMAPSVLDGDHVYNAREENTYVEYRDVTFSYNKEQPVLDNFGITIEPGEKVGIVGLSGAGKTTFANLLLRFFDPGAGQIFLNGVDIKNFTQEFLRSHISYISQDTSLFHASIAENIAYGSRAVSEEEVKQAATMAYADEFIKTLPSGYESIVGEHGIKLSGGQRQRITIARALLANRPLFLLDEATSSLDSDSEEKIQKGLATLMENKTVIAIAHRLSTLSHMNRIIFLENGKIVEDGTHEELLAQNGKYAKLWKMQAGGFLPTQ